MAIKVYTSDVSKLYVGTSAVTKAYVGTTQVYGGSQPAHDYSQDYTTLSFTETGTFKLSGNSIDYSTDDGSTWTTLANNTVSPTIPAGTKVRLRRTHSTGATGKIVTTGRYVLEGNSMSLVYGDNFTGQTSLNGKDNVFNSLFFSSFYLTSAENFILPATTLATSCYQNMFYGCTRLTTAPDLPATTLATGCYNSMFMACTSLTTAPVLSAAMIATNCCQSMFEGCTSLATAPALSATTLANNCYTWMFKGCTSLTTTPELPATALTFACYQGMFQNCTSLTTVTELPATTLADFCYQSMFSGCSSLTTAPELPATTLTYGCYSNMFNGCSSLEYIKCMAEGWIDTYGCTNSWVSGVAANGMFVKSLNSNWDTGDNGIPSGWDVQIDTPFE